MSGRRIGRLQIDEVGHRFEYAVQFSAVNAPRQLWLGIEYCAPVGRVIETVQCGRCVRQEQVCEVAVELRTAVTSGHGTGAVETMAAAKHLDRSSDVDESRGQADLAATQVFWLALTVCRS